MDVATIRKLRVVDLKEALTALSLSTKGKKKDLAERLEKYYANLEKDSAEKESITTESQEGESKQSVSTANTSSHSKVDEEDEKETIFEQATVPETSTTDPDLPIIEKVSETFEVTDKVSKVTLENKETDQPLEQNDKEESQSQSQSHIQEQSLQECETFDQSSSLQEQDSIEPGQMEIRISNDYVLVEPTSPENFEMIGKDDYEVVESMDQTSEITQHQETEMNRDGLLDEPVPVAIQVEEVAEQKDVDDNSETNVEVQGEEEPYEQQAISPPAYADLDEEEENDLAMRLVVEERKRLEQQLEDEREREHQLANLNKNLLKTKDGKALVLQTVIQEEPERLQALEDFKNGKISKSKLIKIKKRLAKKSKKERDMKAFRSNLTADSDTRKKRRGKKHSNTQESIEIDYITKPVELGDIFAAPVDSLYPQDDIERTKIHFERVLNKFIVEPSEPSIHDQVLSAAENSQALAKKMGAHYKEPKDYVGKDEDGEDSEEKELSKRKMKKLHRPTVAHLKQLAQKPDVVEIHDTTSSDPRLLVHLKGYRNAVPVPRHWCLKRKYLTSKRGFEKPPFELPEFIQRTGISEIRDALLEKDEIRNRASKQRQKMRPKLGKIHMDYEKLHDAFFRYQTKPKMTLHGDLYYEGKELEVKLKEKKPGELSDTLRIALGMPIGPHAHRCPPPWLIAMQRYGPPPSFPNLKIPGLNAPIPAGCSFGYHAGGWGKPPVDEYGRPLYGDVFGNNQATEEEEIDQGKVNFRWGQLESDSESEEESESEEDDDLDQKTAEVESDDELDNETAAAAKAEKMAAAAAASSNYEAGVATPSGTQSTLSSNPGIETPQQIQLRKRHEIEASMEQKEHKDLFKVIPQTDPGRSHSGALRSSMMGSSHTYDLSDRKRTGKMGKDGIEVALTAEELAMDESSIRQRLAQKMQRKQQEDSPEDYSDMVRDHIGQTERKRRAQDARSRGGDDGERYDKRRR